jgi:hypothetical protein
MGAQCVTHPLSIGRTTRTFLIGSQTFPFFTSKWSLRTRRASPSAASRYDVARPAPSVLSRANVLRDVIVRGLLVATCDVHHHPTFLISILRRAARQAYQLFFGLLRRLKRALFANTCVSVLLMDKYSTDKSQIRLRWKIEAGERLPDIDRAAMLQSMGFDSVDKLKASGSGDILEGISVYKLDAKGIIMSHKIQVSVMNALHVLCCVNLRRLPAD